MGVTSIFPTADAIEWATPANRDRAIDVIRIASLIGVVAGHTIMATSMIADGVFAWGNLLTTSPVFQALTWIFQVMPLFFFAGVAASVGSWDAGGSWGGWLLKRCTRLYRPVFYYLAFWAATLVVLRPLLPTRVYESIAGISIQLLWFLGVYVVVLAAVPLLARITTVARFVGSVTALYALIALVDGIRVHDAAWSALGYLNLVAWLIPGMFGVAYRRGLFTVRTALVVGVAMFAVNVALVWFGPYELSLVGIDTQELKNMMPPSLLLTGHAIMMCAFAIAAAPAIARWAGRPRVWRLAVIGNSGAMTLYLWHMPALLAVHLAFDYLGLDRWPGQPNFWTISAAQVAVMAVLVCGSFVVLRPLENEPLPLWDGGHVAQPGLRSAVVGTLLCVAGAATLAAAGWGLKDEGLDYVLVVLAALVGARLLARENPVAPTSVR
ncbi:acyltransferase [Mycobacterium sp. AT1]|uniref:acyltransferase family protein n=1 Tax=Mycobacterium sp. AT1 TaxID=1961706 RepID=UPI0009AC356C|nr:acyltransferase [Mycobacterium sp. AT1]OPX11567.1 acyltransferase [Mycobacterium sp. AT1]